MTVTHEITARWSARLDEWRRFKATVDGATIAEEVLTDLAALSRAHGDEVLTLSRAAQRSGYSADHLARLIRQGTIPNAGRRGAPRIRVRDLPAGSSRRPMSKPTGSSYDPVADAQSLLAMSRTP